MGCPTFCWHFGSACPHVNISTSLLSCTLWHLPRQTKGVPVLAPQAKRTNRAGSKRLTPAVAVQWQYQEVKRSGNDHPGRCLPETGCPGEGSGRPIQMSEVHWRTPEKGRGFTHYMYSSPSTSLNFQMEGQAPSITWHGPWPRCSWRGPSPRGKKDDAGHSLHWGN